MLLLLSKSKHSTPEPLYNTLRYNTVFGYNTDLCWTPIAHFILFLLYFYTFYSRYNRVWIANTEIGLDPKNSVIKRLL